MAIQNCWFDYCEYQELLLQYNAATRIQRVWRGSKTRFHIGRLIIVRDNIDFKRAQYEGRRLRERQRRFVWLLLRLLFIALLVPVSVVMVVAMNADRTIILFV